jgi:urocanate hydratase
MEGVVLIGIGIAGYVVCRRLVGMLDRLEAQQIAPVMVRVNAILGDVKSVTSRVREETERVDQAIRATMERVDDTAERVRSNVRAKTSRIIGLVRGARTILETLLQSRAA